MFSIPQQSFTLCPNCKNAPGSLNPKSAFAANCSTGSPKASLAMSCNYHLEYRNPPVRIRFHFGYSILTHRASASRPQPPFAVDLCTGPRLGGEDDDRGSSVICISRRHIYDATEGPSSQGLRQVDQLWFMRNAAWSILKGEASGGGGRQLIP